MAETVKIDQEQWRTMRGWAQDATLQSLVTATNASNTLLKAIGGKRTSNLDIAGQVQQGIIRPLTQGTDDTIKTMRSYKAAIKDLEITQYKYSSATKNLISKFETAGKEPSKLIPELIEGSTGKLAAAIGGVAAMFGKKGKVVGAAVAALGTMVGAASAKVVERFIEAADAFRPMIQSGVTFGGSIDQMVSSVRGAGVSFEAAGRIIEQHGAALVTVGEKNFFAATDRMGSTFKRLAMTGDQGAELLSELSDQMRTTGSLFDMNQEQYTQALESNIRLMQQQSILTGKSIKQQLAERKAVVERASFQALLAGESPEERTRLEQWFDQLVNTMKMSQEQAMGLLLQSKGVGGTTGYASVNLATRGAASDLASRIAAGAGVTDEGSKQAMQLASTYMEGFTREYGKTLAISLEKGINNIFTQAGTSALEGARAGKTIEAALADPEKAEQARKAAEGISVLGTNTQRWYNTMNDITKKFGEAEAKAFELAGENFAAMIDKIVESAKKLNMESISDMKKGLSELVGGDTNLLAMGGAAAGAIGVAAGLKGGSAGAGSGGSMMGQGVMKFAGKMLGIDQLISAGGSLWEGNYGQAAAHLALFAAKKNPVGLAVSLADSLTEAVTGKGVIERGAALFSKNQQEIQSAVQMGRGASITAPNIYTPQQVEDLAIKQAMLQQQIADLEYRKRQGEEDSAELKALREQFAEAVRTLREIRNNQ